ncbi:folate-binding protein [Microvirga tunisiensis]|uniref:Folate-binding protein n=1 Tax=Pannonibacter tanglangensis TaxID=2750084 RepID=A0A7X5F4Z8_9HYPH|nr:folate-binding protein YgfZ [Pannonibacter sp. XCT-53]NBN78895.1 folate-binding protein [Pannonibacter sp. XCT-53]
MSDARHALLASRGVLSLSGPESLHFLNNLVTSDLEPLAPGSMGFAALLSPQGKILFDFLALRTQDGFLLDVDRESAAALAKRLTFYRLRAKVEIADLSDRMAVGVIWHDDGSTPENVTAGGVMAARDPRLPALGLRLFGAAEAVAGVPAACGAGAATEADWQAHRIRHGVPQSGADFALGDAFPHDVDMDQLAGVSFRKGCYVGQEIVARMEHRSTARRRIIQVAADAALPEAGTPVLAGEQQLGTLGSSTANQGLALVRLDKVKAALDNGGQITCGGLPIRLHLPAFARFGWPDGGAAEA